MKKILVKLFALMVIVAVLMTTLTIAVAAETANEITVAGNAVVPYFVLNDNFVFCSESNKAHPENGMLYTSNGTTWLPLDNAACQWHELLNGNDIDLCNKVFQQVIWDLLDNTTTHRNTTLRRLGPDGVALYDAMVAPYTGEYKVVMTTYSVVDGDYQVMVGFSFYVPEPEPTEPEPTEPAPTEPAPTEPISTEPTPVEPVVVPTEPAPVELTEPEFTETLLEEEPVPTEEVLAVVEELPTVPTQPTKPNTPKKVESSVVEEVLGSYEDLESPNTGDSGFLMVIAGVLMLAAIGMAFAIFKLKKNK